MDLSPWDPALIWHAWPLPWCARVDILMDIPIEIEQLVLIQMNFTLTIYLHQFYIEIKY